MTEAAVRQVPAGMPRRLAETLQREVPLVLLSVLFRLPRLPQMTALRFCPGPLGQRLVDGTNITTHRP